VTKYRWIAARSAEGFPVRLCCRVLEMAASSYYDWLHVYGAGATDRELDEAHLVNAIIIVHDSLDDTYGLLRLTHELRHERCVNHKRVKRIVRQHGLYAKGARRRKYRTTILDVSVPPMPDPIGRDFRVGELGLRTWGDITYIPTGEGWLFFAGVLDFGSRRCLGCAMDERKLTEPVSRALRMAADTRSGDVEGMIFTPIAATQSIHVEGVPRALRATRRPPVRRTHGLVSRQCRRRELLGHAQA
jgi:putative transposase